ncbi:hypothetical protein SDC9_116741 [bioreactor metagenome]|uniref:Uncharacterized protein n=1 Tax=bioreactor metagenome TaxID=1076179 RepID=A0A645C377_9ZZZZ
MQCNFPEVLTLREENPFETHNQNYDNKEYHNQAPANSKVPGYLSSLKHHMRADKNLPDAIRDESHS